MKPFLLFTLLLSIIYAQTVSAVGSDDEGDILGKIFGAGGFGEGEHLDGGGDENGDGDWDDEEENGGEGEEEDPSGEDQDSEPILPTLICTLFGTQACNAGCLSVATIYGTDSTGHCDDDNICECQPSENTTLEDLWGRKFDPRGILPQIKNNQQLSEQVMEILKQPIKSTEETKQLLQEVLPGDVFKKIRIKPRAPSNIIPQADGKFNQESTKKWANVKLRPFLNDQFPKGIDYKKSLSEALQNAPDGDTIQHLMHEARLTHNPNLEKVVEDFLKQGDVTEEPQEDREEDIIDFVDRHIINELIKSIETKPKPKQIQKPGARPIVKSNTNTSPPRPGQTSITSSPPRPGQTSTISGPSRTSQTTITSGPPQISRTVTSTSRSGQNPSTTQISEYTLPDTNINKRVIDGFQNSVDKSWSGANYQVRFKRVSPRGDTELWWSKGKDHVYIHRHADGAVDQNWIFGGNVNIGLYKDVDKSQIQAWDFGVTRLDYEKSPNTMPFREWANDNKDEGSYTKYSNAIQSWCNVNDFFIGKEYCVII